MIRLRFILLISIPQYVRGDWSVGTAVGPQPPSTSSALQRCLEQLDCYLSYRAHQSLGKRPARTQWCKKHRGRRYHTQHEPAPSQSTWSPAIHRCTEVHRHPPFQWEGFSENAFPNHTSPTGNKHSSVTQASHSSMKPVVCSSNKALRRGAF